MVISDIIFHVFNLDFRSHILTQKLIRFQRRMCMYKKKSYRSMKMQITVPISFELIQNGILNRNQLLK